MRLKTYIPKGLKISYQLAKRFVKYRVLRDDIRYAKGTGEIKQVQFVLNQELKKSPLFENKVANLILASASISKTMIAPNKTFSFWRIVGNPSRRNGFKRGRNIVNGNLIEDYGGGLCQLSGLIYYLAIKGQLEIIERHNHSVDIYKESERFTPLGSDATIVYGYKDLMIRNNRDFDIQFMVEVRGDKLIGSLCSTETIHELEIEFICSQTMERKRVLGYGPDDRVVNESVYSTGY